MSATLYALAAIALWGTLASLGTSLSHLPPFLLTGLALMIGSVMSWPAVLRNRQAWAVPARTLALGIYGLFGFHFLLFIALRYAPPVEANLVNYLWPLFMVVLAPALLPGVWLRPLHVVAALLGFAGAAIAILGARGDGAAVSGTFWGFVPALGSAFIWASYSLWTRRVPAFPTSAIGLFGFVSGALSLVCHALLEPSATLSSRDWLLVALCGLGPLGRGLLSLGHGAQARRRAPDRHPELHHAAGVDGAAARGDGAAAELEHRAGGGLDHLCGGDGRARPLKDVNRQP